MIRNLEQDPEKFEKVQWRSNDKRPVAASVVEIQMTQFDPTVEIHWKAKWGS